MCHDSRVTLRAEPKVGRKVPPGPICANTHHFRVTLDNPKSSETRSRCAKQRGDRWLGDSDAVVRIKGACKIQEVQLFGLAILQARRSVEVLRWGIQAAVLCGFAKRVWRMEWASKQVWETMKFDEKCTYQWCVLHWRFLWGAVVKTELTRHFWAPGGLLKERKKQRGRRIKTVRTVSKAEYLPWCLPVKTNI